MEPRPTPRRSRFRRPVLRTIAAAIITVLLVAGIGWAAWNISTLNTADLTAASLGTPGSPTATRTAGTGDNCTTIQVAWSAVPNATSYRVERNVNGTWTELAANHGGSPYNDVGSWTNYEIEYRVSARLGNWLSPTPATAAMACGTGDVDDLAFTFASSCISTQLDWTTPLGTVTGYNVEYRMNAGAWTAVTGGTNIATTTFTDTNVYTTMPHGDLEYRVTARNGATIGNPSNVVAPTTDYGCLVPPTAVDATGCLINNRTITWTAAPSPVTGYDVRRQVNGGGYTTVSANVMGTSWNDTFSVTAGQLVDYNLYSRNSTLIDNVLSATDSMRSGFYVTSVAFGNTGTLGTLNVGDTVTVTFSQPVAAGTVTSTNVNTVATGGTTRGAYLATTATGVTAATSDIMRLNTAASHFSTGNAAGSVSWNSDRTVWTWTANAGVPAITHAATLAGTQVSGTAGTRAKCGGNNLLTTPAPTYSGRW